MVITFARRLITVSAVGLAGYFLEPVDFLMTRKMLLGIKWRAEQASTLVAV